MTIIPNYEEKQAREAEFQRLYCEWYRNRTPQEETLSDLISDYEEEFFDDFTFQSDSVVAPFLEYKIEEDGEKVIVYEDVPTRTSIKDTYYRCQVNDIDDETEGQINSAERIIIIPPRNLNNKGIILHEMIHAYEDILHWTDKERLLICLYRDLSDKIPNLDERIFTENHLIIGTQTAYQGGHHGILFHLKSLDLDCRCRFNLGTVFGYMRNEEQG